MMQLHLFTLYNEAQEETTADPFSSAIIGSNALLGFFSLLIPKLKYFYWYFLDRGFLQCPFGDGKRRCGTADC